jgi:hypothetical protein
MGTAASRNDGGLEETAGIIPRACQDLFQSIQEKCVDGKATVTLSYLELYNEKIRDLFAVDRNSKASQDLRIRETPGGSVEVAGCVEKIVNNPTEIGAAMEEAGQRRVVAATAMNATSSRSHAICTLRIRGTLKDDDENQPANNTRKRFSSMLTLVDLAGSERIKKTGAQGARQTEGININKSLLVLGQVVSALSQGSGPRARKPPYRDSKLTRLLQDSLGGNSRTIMVACVSPAHVNLEETTNTLRYAASARRITNRARQNVAVTSTLSPHQVAALQKENITLQEQMAQLQEAMAMMQQELQQARTELASHEKRSPPSRTVSHAHTASTSGLSEDDEMTNVSHKKTDEDSIPVHIGGEKAIESASNGKELVGESLVNQTIGEAQEAVLPTDVSESPSIEHNTSTMTTQPQSLRSQPADTTKDSLDNEQETSADGCHSDLDDLDESDALSDWLDEDEDDEVISLPEDAANLLRKREAAYFLELSNHKLIIADLEARIDIYRDLEQENTALQSELEEAKEDAESARKAANLLSDIVDELRGIKRGELEEKQQQLNMTMKEQNWISFVQAMLQNYRMQVGQLSMTFNKTVIPAIDNIDFTVKSSEPVATTREDAKTEAPADADTSDLSESAQISKDATVGTNNEEIGQAPIPSPAAAPAPTRTHRVGRRRSWWGGIVEETVPEPPKIIPWKEAAEKFDTEIHRLENMLIFEAESMQSIQTGLADEVLQLEREVGLKKLETQSLMASTIETEKDELLENLSSLLLQRSVHAAD